MTESTGITTIDVAAPEAEACAHCDNAESARLWRDTFKVHLTALSNRMDRLEEQQTELVAQVAEHTKQNAEIKADTAQIIELFKGAKAAFDFLAKCAKVLSPVGKVAGWILGLGTALAAALHIGGTTPGAGK